MIFALMGDDEGPPAADDARAYLADWEEGDYAAMEERVFDAPTSFEEIHQQIVDNLDVTSSSYELGEVDTSGDSASPLHGPAAARRAGRVVLRRRSVDVLATAVAGSWTGPRRHPSQARERSDPDPHAGGAATRTDRRQGRQAAWRPPGRAGSSASNPRPSRTSTW